MQCLRCFSSEMSSSHVDDLHTHTNKHTHTHAHIHTHMHTRTHTHTHAHTHIHTHTKKEITSVKTAEAARMLDEIDDLDNECYVPD